MEKQGRYTEKQKSKVEKHVAKAEKQMSKPDKEVAKTEKHTGMSEPEKTGGQNREIGGRNRETFGQNRETYRYVQTRETGGQNREIFNQKRETGLRSREALSRNVQKSDKNKRSFGQRKSADGQFFGAYKQRNETDAQKIDYRFRNHKLCCEDLARYGRDLNTPDRDQQLPCTDLNASGTNVAVSKTGYFLYQYHIQ